MPIKEGSKPPAYGLVLEADDPVTADAAASDGDAMFQVEESLPGTAETTCQLDHRSSG